MVSSQVLQKTIDELRAITRIDLCVLSLEGQKVASTFSEEGFEPEYVREFVKSLGLSLNGKTQIIPFKCGISFLGFHHYMTEDGKYIRKINSYNKRRIRKKLLSWSKLVKSGKMQEEKFYEKYNAWRNHAMHGNCIKLCNTMDLYCKKILESE